MRDILSDLENGAQLSDPDPIRRAQIQMKTPLPKRFYEKASAEAVDGGFGVFLDGKAVRTPSRAQLVLPTLAAAQIIADEFSAQQDVIDPTTMHATRLANTAIDGIAADPQAVLEDILRFSANDMLFYRADSPERLVQRQTELWDPMIDWADGFGARFTLAEGVMHVAQPHEAIAAFSRQLSAFSDPLAIGALHMMTTLSGSAIIALAIAKREISAEHGWNISILEEDWSRELWGDDAEAAKRLENRKAEFMAAYSLLDALDLQFAA